MSQWTYWVSAVLALGGTGTAVAGIIRSEFKPFTIGLIMIFGATVFARLYLGTRRSHADASDHQAGGL